MVQQSGSQQTIANLSQISSNHSCYCAPIGILPIEPKSLCKSGAGLTRKPHTYYSDRGTPLRFLKGNKADKPSLCLTTDAHLTADPEIQILILTQSHTLEEIDHELVCIVINLPWADNFKKSCCQL